MARFCGVSLTLKTFRITSETEDSSNKKSLFDVSGGGAYLAKPHFAKSESAIQESAKPYLAKPHSAKPYPAKPISGIC